MLRSKKRFALSGNTRTKCPRERVKERFGFTSDEAMFGVGNRTIDVRTKPINLYLRLMDMEGLWFAHTIVIARLGFQEERIGHGTDFLRFISKVAKEHRYKYIGLECTNEKSTAFGLKHGFRRHKESSDNYNISVKELFL
ncbi:GNAT family N-acetyltransferase [Dysgonomonas reticulitermitis]